MVAETNGEVQAAPRGAGRQQAGSRVRGGVPHAEALALVEAVFPGVRDLPDRLTADTMKEYTRDGLLYLRFCQMAPEAARDPAGLRAWRQQMVSASTLSPWTINRRLAAIK